jgi:hypothetical protein
MEFAGVPTVRIDQVTPTSYCNPIGSLFRSLK